MVKKKGTLIKRKVELIATYYYVIAKYNVYLRHIYSLWPIQKQTYSMRN